MKNALVIGGSSGMGLAVAVSLSKICKKVNIVDRREPSISLPGNCFFFKADLTERDYSWVSGFKDINTLFYSAGFGRIATFDDLEDWEIQDLFTVNAVGFFRILLHFMPQLSGTDPFYCGAMVSIAGRIASPLFSIYSATKAALFRGIEAINTELEMKGSNNRILEVSPGSLKGTSFNGGETRISILDDLSADIIRAMKNHDTLLIPEYEEIFKSVMARYQKDPAQFARESYEYKIASNRLQNRQPSIVSRQ